MHYEITADKSVLHSRGQPTAFMNENLYCSLASRGRARSTPRRPRTDAETAFNNLSSPHLLSIFCSTAIECRPIRFGLDTLSFSILSPSPFPRSREIDDKERRETWNRF